jgi:deoxyribodipyrimidine photo-lyase
MVEPERIQPLNDLQPHPDGKYVLYWVQASQREGHNPALEYAITVANDRGQTLLCCFGLMDDYPEANARHYAFMLQGLADLRTLLEKRGIKLVCKHGHTADVALHYAKDASIVVTDRGYTRHQRGWRERVAREAGRRVVQVETDVVVPVELASPRHEIGARTLRPKIHRLWEKYLVPLAPVKLKHPSPGLSVHGDIDLTDPEGALKRLKVDRSVAPTSHFVGGQTVARKLLAAFVAGTLPGYGEGRNEPAAGISSKMSMYLQFGNISPVELALAARDSSAPVEDRDTYLEELIVRRELSHNFCQYNAKYDQYECLPEWARKSLAAHAKDPRPHLYTRDRLEAADTFDPYWNAAQLEMVRTGFMHNYMRMYWGKKILEWSATPEEAYATTIRLNNKYFLCGRGPNAFANVAWIFGLHDRPWGPERQIFGLVRYMNSAGLERKFDIDRYVTKVALLA